VVEYDGMWSLGIQNKRYRCEKWMEKALARVHWWGLVIEVSNLRILLQYSALDRN